VIGIVTTPNPASVRLHNACGFELVGTLREVGRKFDNWHGTAIYQRMIGNDETAA
jgi:phosphinothricin acetyltransferase